MLLCCQENVQNVPWRYKNFFRITYLHDFTSDADNKKRKMRTYLQSFTWFPFFFMKVVRIGGNMYCFRLSCIHKLASLEMQCNNSWKGIKKKGIGLFAMESHTYIELCKFVACRQDSFFRSKSSLMSWALSIASFIMSKLVNLNKWESLSYLWALDHILGPL